MSENPSPPTDASAVRSVAGIQAHLRAKALAAIAALGGELKGELELVPPPKPELGDWGFPCFALAKSLRKAPPLIAKEVAAKIEPDALVARVATEGAYVNLSLAPAALAAIVLEEVLRERDRFGAGQAAPAKQVMVEFSSPNTNKPLHLGHLRNNVLGSSVASLLEFFGHKVTRVNLVNDRGVHICKSMLAYRRFGEGIDPERAGKKGDHLVGDFYVRFDRAFSEEYAAWKQTAAARAKLAAWLEGKAGEAALAAAAKDPAAPAAEKLFFDGYKDAYFNSDSALGAEVRELLRRWEDGDAETLELWRRMNGWVLAGFDASYARLGVRFDETQFESETYKLGKALVEDGLARGVLRRLEDGAVVCDLAQVKLKGEKVLLRSDGTSVYMTQDLGTAVMRFERFALDRLIYVVGDEQLYHFEVLFKILGLLRPGLADACYHLAYGMIRLPEGKMKSREGTVVDADDLMDEMRRLAREETRSRADEGKAHSEGIDEAELEHRAERIGMAALKYYLLKFTPRKSFEYDPKESIDFLGQTGPYCLFNYARTRSLLRKALAGEDPAFGATAAARLGSDRERELVRLLAAFPETVARAAQSLDPSRLTEYLFELSKAFAFVFTDKANHPIATCEDAELRHGRLMLVAAIGHTLRAGLGLLGIEALEEM
jgi:arginyl-tRNA synthetase